MATPARRDVVASIFRLTDKAAARDKIFRQVQVASYYSLANLYSCIILL